MARCVRGATHRYHVQPFEGARIDPASLAVTGIDPLPSAAAGDPGEGRAAAHLPRESAARCATPAAGARCSSGHNAVVRPRVPQRRRGAHRDQAQSVPSVLELRHGDARRALPSGRPCWRARVVSRRASNGIRRWRTPPSTTPRRTADLFCLSAIEFRPIYEDALARRVAELGLEPAAPIEGGPTDPPPASAERTEDYEAAVRCLLRPRRRPSSQQLLQLAAAVHLQRDVAAADQLAVDVELRIGRPVRVALERIAQLRILEDVHVRELRAARAQRARHRLRGKAALRESPACPS